MNEGKRFDVLPGRLLERVYHSAVFRLLDAQGSVCQGAGPGRVHFAADINDDPSAWVFWRRRLPWQQTIFSRGKKTLTMDAG